MPESRQPSRAAPPSRGWRAKTINGTAAQSKEVAGLFVRRDGICVAHRSSLRVAPQVKRPAPAFGKMVAVIHEQPHILDRAVGNTIRYRGAETPGIFFRIDDRFPKENFRDFLKRKLIIARFRSNSSFLVARGANFKHNSARLSRGRRR